MMDQFDQVEFKNIFVLNKANDDVVASQETVEEILRSTDRD